MVRVQRIGLPIVWSDPKTRAVGHAEKAPRAHFTRRSMRGRIRSGFGEQRIMALGDLANVPAGSVDQAGRRRTLGNIVV
jgi:hypothetical protein